MINPDLIIPESFRRRPGEHRPWRGPARSLLAVSGKQVKPGGLLHKAARGEADALAADLERKTDPPQTHDRSAADA